MTPAELLDLLQELHREMLALVRQHQMTARAVRAYEANNAYQQVIGRQMTQLEWLASAIADMGASVSSEPGHPVDAPASGEPLAAVLERDVSGQQAFIARWERRISNVTHARHRKMLELLLGELREHQRVFQQALDGRRDLLGRPGDRRASRGDVLPARPGAGAAIER